MLLGDRAEWRELTTACIGEDNVDLATRLLNSVIETVDIGELAHIALHAAHAAADLFDCGGERFLAAAGDEHSSAFGREGFGRGEADAARAAGHHNHLAVEPMCHRLSPSSAASRLCRRHA